MTLVPRRAPSTICAGWLLVALVAVPFAERRALAQTAGAPPAAVVAQPAQTTQASPAGPSVRGIVVHAVTQAPIADARVSVGDPAQSVLTGPDGRFGFTSVPPGQHTLTVSTIGFIFVRRRIDVRPDAVLEITIPLAEGTGTYQESVTVSADAARSRDPGVSSVELGSAALQDLRGVAADDPVRAMQALPGVATGDDFQAEFSVRGSAFRQVGIVIDGTATPVLFHAVRGADDNGSIAMINTDVLGHASLSSGPHPRRHGDWLGATLEFDVREGSRDRVAVRGAVSGTNAAIVLDGPLAPGKRGSWLVSLRKSYVDWLIKKIDPEVESTFGFLDLHTKAVFDLTARQQLQFTMIGGSAVYKRPTATGANQIYRATSRSLLASLGWRYTPGPVVYSQRLSYAVNDFRNTGVFGQQQAAGETSAAIWRGDAVWAMSRAWSFEAGLRGEVQNTHADVRDLTLTNGVFRTRTQLLMDVTTTVANAWAQIARRGASRSFALGGRAIHDTLFRAPRVSPWLLAEQRWRTFVLSASAGDFTQLPTTEQVGHGARAMHPERVFSAELGVAHALSSSINWRVVAFGRRESDVMRRVAEDQIVGGRRVVGLPFPIYSSDLRGRSKGADVVVERRAARGPSGWIAYTWAHTRYDDTRTGESFDGDFDQRHTLNIFVQQRLSYRMNASVKLRVGSNVPVVGYFEGTTDALRLSALRNRVRLPVYSRLDLRGSRTFTFERHRLTLFVEVMNALGRRNLGQTDGSIRTNLEAVNYIEKLLPVIPSAGILIEF
jgi:hypothetical protein